MKFLQIKQILGVAVILLWSCNQEYNTVGVELIASNQFDTRTQTFPVYVETDQLTDVAATNLAVGHFGSYNFPFFGKRTAHLTTQFNFSAERFGLYTQEEEVRQDPNVPYMIAEEEQITEVFLEIPFLINQNDQDNDGVIDAYDVDSTTAESDSDNDGVIDLIESQNGTNPLSSDSDNDGIPDSEDEDNSAYDSNANLYQIDSIIGNRNTRFGLKVVELDYFFNALDIANNFETSANYFSSQDVVGQGFQGAVLYDGDYQLNLEELTFFYDEDNPDTPDIDESTQVESRLSPRIRIPLDPAFFQQKIIDFEGAPELESTQSFNRHFKGINIQMDDSSEDLYMLLNFQQTQIKITYEHKRYNDNGTPEDTSDFTIDTVEKQILLNRGLVSVNHFVNQAGSETLSPSTLEKIPLIGGLGNRATIRLFDKDSTTDVLANFKRDNLLINEANLIFYVDPEFIENWSPNERIAERIYLYDLTNNAPLLDYFSDTSAGSADANNKIIHSGILEYQDGIPFRYKIRITEHVSNMVRVENENISDNNPLGLVVTSNINLFMPQLAKVENDIETNYPVGALYNPYGTVLIGTDPTDNTHLDKKLQLEIIYTDFSN